MNNYGSVHVSFLLKNSFTYKSQTSVSQNLKFLNLLDHGLEFLPRTFTITTQNGSYKFNTDILKDSSTVISEILQEDPEKSEYHIDINDKEKVMEKFEKMYQGLSVTYDINDLSTLRQITSALNVRNCPIFMQPERFLPSSFSIQTQNTVQIDKISLGSFIKNNIPLSFTIKANNKEYKCNKYGIYSSKVLSELLQKDPNLNEYVYNFEDENDENEFHSIIDFFNFNNIQITADNMNSLLKFIEDLKIDIFKNDLNEFINSYENAVQLIDDQKTIINSIDDLFSWLYHINELTIEKTTENILQSVWVTSKENVQELAACILQVVRTDIFAHSNVIDLIISLDKLSSQNSNLQILYPFILNYIKSKLHINYLYSAFAYKLYQKKFITFDEILNENSYINLIKNYNSMPEASVDNEMNELNSEDKIMYDFNLLIWFFPEINELNKNLREMFLELIRELNCLPKRIYSNICNLFKNIDKLKMMREFGQPNDEITLAILNDDVDKLQTIITNGKIDINQAKIPFNLYEIFIFKNIGNSFINYAAEYGSIKCFKYLLLNHADMDAYTLGCAVYGGNTEIIRIVYQQKSDNLITQKNKKPVSNNSFLFDEMNIQESLLNPMIPAIMKHRNDIFDWLLDQQYSSKEKDGKLLIDILTSSVQNGNAHVLIECIDKGIDFRSLSSNLCQNLFIFSASNGFYRLLKLLFNLIEDKLQTSFHEYISSKMARSSVSFGILSIFKLLSNVKNVDIDYVQALFVAISNDYPDIVHYIIEQNYSRIQNKDLPVIFTSAIQKKFPDFFNLLENKFKINIHYNMPIKDLRTILRSGCRSGNFEAVKKIIDIIISINPNFDFTDPFIISIKNKNEDICFYLMSINVCLDYNLIARYSSSITKGSAKIALQLINSVEQELKETFKNCFISSAIKNANKDLIEYLSTNDKPNNNALIYAVESNNIDIVNIILSHNSDPFFINQISSNGTALDIAVKKNNLQIVQRLLSLPGINPDLYSNNGCTPLVSAITNLNLEITNAILDFYGDKIQSQTWQLNKALKRTLKRISGDFITDEDIEYNDVNDIVGIDYTDHNEEEDKKKNVFLKNNQEKIIKIINRLMDIENIDLNCYVYKYTLLTYACEANEIDLIKTLIKSDKVNVNSYAPLNGNTPLMIAIENKNIEISQLLIDHPRTDINLRNYNEQTALVLAVKHNLESIVNLIITNEKFDPDQSCLNKAFFISSGQISKRLYEIKDLDVNYCFDHFKPTKHNYYDEYYENAYDMNGNSIRFGLENKEKFLYESTLVNAVKLKNTEKIDMIIFHPCFDIEKSQVKTALFLTIKNRMIDTYHKLLKLFDNDVNITLRGESLLYCSFNANYQEITEEILGNEKFDPIKSDFMKVFMSIFLESIPGNDFQDSIIDKLNLLADYDESHSHMIDFTKLLPNGKSFFTLLTKRMNNQNIVEFFLEHNVDPNMPDKSGIYPLQYLIMKNFLTAFITLIESEKINLSIKLNGNNPFEMKNETFLHFAARFIEPNFVQSILNRHLVDVNSVDDLGETPLMKACRMRKIPIIVQLFRCDDLDYLHCNNDGDDALKIVEKMRNNQKHVFKKSRANHMNIDNISPEKRAYLEKLINLCNF